MLYVMKHCKQHQCLEAAFRNTISLGIPTFTFKKFRANKDIEGRQRMIIWHLDDNKIMHRNKDIIWNRKYAEE